MEKMRLDNGLKEIAIENEKGEITGVLKINVYDSRVVQRFSKLIQNLNGVSDEYKREVKRLEEKYKDAPADSENEDIDRAVDYSNSNVNFLNKCISEIDAVFGEGTIKTVFSECYQIHSDFVPDEYALTQFIDEIIHVMNKLFNARFEENKKRYGAGKRGKKTK